MGFAVPAALGAQIARPDHRVLTLVGDGAFQMTGTELSTHACLELNPIVWFLTIVVTASNGASLKAHSMILIIGVSTDWGKSLVR